MRTNESTRVHIAVAILFFLQQHGKQPMKNGERWNSRLAECIFGTLLRSIIIYFVLFIFFSFIIHLSLIPESGMRATGLLSSKLTTVWLLLHPSFCFPSRMNPFLFQIFFRLFCHIDMQSTNKNFTEIKIARNNKHMKSLFQIISSTLFLV